MMTADSGLARFSELCFRTEVGPSDAGKVRDLTEATGFFSAAEVEIAVELVEERLARGGASGYEFLFAECQAKVLGYTCFGPIPCAQSSYDLYWIVVDPHFQGRGVGKALLEHSETLIRCQGGRRVYIETSGRGQYQATRHFYLRCSYRQAACLDDFYAPGDSKLIYCKAL